MSEERPKVYAWCNSGLGTDCQVWMAMADDGTLLASHFSSTREFGISDTSPARAHRVLAYDEQFGGHQEGVHYELVVLPAGQGPPEEVAERNRAQGRQAAEHGKSVS